MDAVKIQVRFSKETKHGRYSDSLYFTPEDYETLLPEQLEAMKEERVNRWVTMMDNRVVHEPTEEDLLREKERLEEELAELNARLGE